MRRPTGPQLDMIRPVLQEWDPIGVVAMGGPMDEYDAYLSHVAALLLERKRASEVAAFLHTLETVHMGLNGNYRKCEACAEALVGLDLPPGEF